MAQAFIAQAEPGKGINLAGEQPVAGQAELNEVIQHGFAEFVRAAVLTQALVLQQTILLADIAYRQSPTLVVANAVAGAEAYPGQGGGAYGIMPGFTAGREQYDNQAVIL